jgi:hypothetical protein
MDGRTDGQYQQAKKQSKARPAGRPAGRTNLPPPNRPTDRPTVSTEEDNNEQLAFSFLSFPFLSTMTISALLGLRGQFDARCERINTA